MNQDNLRSPNFLEVLLTLKNNVLRNTYVADIGAVTAVPNNQICTVQSITRDLKYECIAPHNLTLHEKDIVTILFTDNYAADAFQKKKNNQRADITPKGDSVPHQLTNGVIVNLLWRE